MELEQPLDHLLEPGELMLMPAYCTVHQVILEPEQRIKNLTIDELGVLYLIMTNKHPTEKVESIIYARDAITILHERNLKNRGNSTF